MTAEQLAGWKAQHPGAVVVMHVNTGAQVKALTEHLATSPRRAKGDHARGGGAETAPVSIGSPARSHALTPPSTALAVIPAERSTFIAAAALRPVPDSTTGRSRSNVESSLGNSSNGIARAPGMRGRSTSSRPRRSITCTRPSCNSVQALDGDNKDSSIGVRPYAGPHAPPSGASTPTRPQKPVMRASGGAISSPPDRAADGHGWPPEASGLAWLVWMLPFPSVREDELIGGAR
jgi:hypothetical protein